MVIVFTMIINYNLGGLTILRLLHRIYKLEYLCNYNICEFLTKNTGETITLAYINLWLNGDSKACLNVKM